MTSSPVSISLWFRGGLGPGRHGRMAREPSQPTGRSCLVYSRSSGWNSSQNIMPPVTPWNSFNLEGSCRDWAWGVLKAAGAQQGGDRVGGGSKGVKETRQRKGGFLVLELGPCAPLTQLRAAGQGRTSRLWSGSEPCTDARTLHPAASPCHPSLPCTRSPQPEPEVLLRVVRSPLHAWPPGVVCASSHHGSLRVLGLFTWLLRVSEASIPGPRQKMGGLSDPASEAMYCHCCHALVVPVSHRNSPNVTRSGSFRLHTLL